MLKSPRLVGGAGRSWLGLRIALFGLGGGFVSGLVLSSAARVWIASA
jgi:hypothetical protein